MKTKHRFHSATVLPLRSISISAAVDRPRAWSLTTNSVLWLTLAALIVSRPTAFAQGNLTPPGAPGPTFKTLEQIEPRKPISALPFTITDPGSYYVTTNLT